AQALVRGAVAELEREPSLLFLMIESQWQDTRHAAIDLLRTRFDLTVLGKGGIVAVCDSTRTDVQDLGKELGSKEMAREPSSIDELLTKLVEHPHPNMRSFALELAAMHLRKGFVQLAKVEPLCRAILMSLKPKRRDKDAVIAFLLERAMADERQA